MRSIVWDENKPEEAVQAVLSEFDRGKPVIVPTDTVYGLAAPISDVPAIRSIFRMKERPPDMTLPVATGCFKHVDMVSIPTKEMMCVLRRDLPGPYTFILPAVHDLPDEVVRQGTVAFRIPEHPFFSMICDMSGPIALTSANIHGMDTIRSLEEADRQLGSEDLLMLIDDGGIAGEPSEIVDLTKGVPIVLRKGKVNIDENMRGHDG